MKDTSEIISQARNVISLEISALKKVRHNITNDFADAVTYVMEARTVIVSGIGKSGIIARKVAVTMTSVGTRAIFLHPAESLHGDIGIVEQGDVAVFFSKSGSTIELMQMIPYLKKRNVKIISILGKIDSPLSKLSDVVLNAEVELEACPLNLAPTASTMAALAIGDALAMVVMQLKNVSQTDFAENHPAGQLGKNINIRVREIMHTGYNIPLISIQDSFRLALIVSSSKALGCVCVTGNDGKLVGIITDGDVRRILQNYDDIRTLNVEQVMIPNPITINKDALLGEAISLMENRQRQISVLPVTDSMGICIGIIRLHDILLAEL